MNIFLYIQEEILKKLNIIGKLPMKYKKTYERDESNQSKYSEKYFLIFFWVLFNLN